MSTFEGTIVQAEEKTSKKGKPYIRLEIDNGNKAWWTGFCTLQPLSVGARCIFSVKTVGDGDIIDDYNIIVPGTGSAAPSAGAHSAAPAASGKHYGSRDMWIATECIYQHWLAKCEGEVSPDTISIMVKAAADMAIEINEKFKDYETRETRPAVALIKTVTEGMTDRNPPPGAYEKIDDDIPF